MAQSQRLVDLTEREKVIQGFCHMFSEIVAEQDYILVDGLIKQAYEFSQMSNKEF